MKTIIAWKIHKSPPMQDVRMSQFFRDVPDDRADEVLAKLRSINKENPHIGRTNEISYYYESAELVKS